MHRSIFIPVANAAAALLVVACEAPADQAASQDYVVHNTVEARSIVSEVFRGDDRVAEAVLADGRQHITVLADDRTMVSAPLDFDARAELDRYSTHLAGAVSVLEQAQAQAQVVPRADCGYGYFLHPNGESDCIASWCSDGCQCVDCIPIDPPGFEYHYCSEQCGPIYD